MSHELLPLCDVLFNIISLASYFCDVVFDVVMLYTLYARQEMVWFTVALVSILSSLFICQICSLRWYLENMARRQTSLDCNFMVIAVLHVGQMGVLYRYFRLFIPVDLQFVKHEVRDLCMLRLIHAFCEAGPMLLLQMYLIWLKTTSASDLTDLNIVSTVLSLFSICWALASFSKNVRRHNVHRLVLTWLGVIFQFTWRLGTITSRSLALTVYATVYGYWLFLVIGLHWMTMFLWLMSPKNVFHGEKMSLLKKISFSMLIAFCYIICYINLQEINPRQKMVAFYVTMLLENTLLVSVWLGGLTKNPWYQYHVTVLVFVTFATGILFMFLYYKHFHVKRLQKNYAMSSAVNVYSSCTGCQLGECSEKSHRLPFSHYLNEFSTSENSTLGSSQQTMEKSKGMTTGAHLPGNSNGKVTGVEGVYVPGVFNCRLNPVVKRKKKKPSSFVPPPAPVITSLVTANNSNSTRMHPFWKTPLPQQSLPSDHEGSICSKVNIQQKLHEKKQKQIAELRQIEEEIKSGKLKRPHPSDISESGTVRQPIPRAKKQPWLRPGPQYHYIVPDTSDLAMLAQVSRKPRSQTPEILLAPHYLDNTRVYYDYQDPRWKYGNSYHLPSDEVSGSSRQSSRSAEKERRGGKNAERDKTIYKSYRIPSDLDSQISLPRSYTLPREFKYYRRPKSRKMIRMDLFLASTNSSDGDVDSFDEVDILESTDRLNNDVMCGSGGYHHYHHHHLHKHHHHHSVQPNHQVNYLGDSPPPPPPQTQTPIRSRIYSAFQRNFPNTHETKL